MVQATLLTEEARKSLLGRQLPSAVLEVERGHIKRFAEAIGDPSPLWNDPVAARRSRYGGIIAPPTFLRAVRTETVQIPELQPLRRALDGGSEWEYFEPVRPGDTITATPRITEVAQRNLRVGPAVFVILETTYTNQWGQVVATQKSTLIRY